MVSLLTQKLLRLMVPESLMEICSFRSRVSVNIIDCGAIWRKKRSKYSISREIAKTLRFRASEL